MVSAQIVSGAPLLADKGLAVALGSQVAKSRVPVRVDTDGIERYPPEVEAAIYFCALEAIQNVVKYANARGATVRLRTEDRSLVFLGAGRRRWFRSGSTISWLIGKLWACADVMTRSLCADLLVPQDSTYAQGVRALRANGKA